MLKLSITLPNSAQINLESEDSAVVDKILGIVLVDVTRALLASPGSQEPGQGRIDRPETRLSFTPPSSQTPAPSQATEPAAAPTVASPPPQPMEQAAPPSHSQSVTPASAGPGIATDGQTAGMAPPVSEAPPEPQSQPIVQDVARMHRGPETLEEGEQILQWPAPEAAAGVAAGPTAELSDRPEGQSNGIPAMGGSQISAATLVPAVSEQAFVDFCRAANPLGDMRRVVVAAEGASRYLAMEGVDAEGLGRLFDIAGWPRAHNFVQTLRNAARSKFGWLERIPGRAGHYTVTDLGRATALGR